MGGVILKIDLLDQKIYNKLLLNLHFRIKTDEKNKKHWINAYNYRRSISMCYAETPTVLCTPKGRMFGSSNCTTDEGTKVCKNTFWIRHSCTETY